MGSRAAKMRMVEESYMTKEKVPRIFATVPAPYVVNTLDMTCAGFCRACGAREVRSENHPTQHRLRGPPPRLCAHLVS